MSNFYIHSAYIPEDNQHYLTVDKHYLVTIIDNEVLIVDDVGDTLPIKLKGCHYLDGRDWDVVLNTGDCYASNS